MTKRQNKILRKKDQSGHVEKSNEISNKKKKKKE
jgi:hypothetical protein